MKPIRIVLTPTRSRPLNIFLGLLLLLAALLLLLALATYHATDPSWDTSTDVVDLHPARNWIGLFGALLSDQLLQWIGLAAFLIPLWLGGLGWTWMRSRPSGSPLLRWTGSLLSLLFLPSCLGLLPWHWRWLGVLPIEGVTGRIFSGFLKSYLNGTGAWLVAAALAATGLYFSSAVSFWVIRETLSNRFASLQHLSDRWHNWREERAEIRFDREELKASRREDGGIPRRAKHFSQDGEDLESIPAFQRVQTQAEAQDEENEPEPPRRRSVWERSIADIENEAPPAEEDLPVVPEPQPPITDAPIRTQPWEEQPAAVAPIPVPPAVAPVPIPVPRPVAAASVPAPQPAGDDHIAIHDRLDTEVRTATVAPKNVSGFKLPPSTLLTPGDGPGTIKEDYLRDEARVLVEKCAEFDVRGQVVQINPGPMVTTYEFKPEAGVKYSRVTGLADDLCLAMRAESILIERMAGKSTVGIQVPNREKETIHLRDVIESETFAKAKSRLTLSMGKDINGRIVTADLATMPHVLIAGSTGSGKSVAINAMIMSLLYRTTPQQVRLILVDPKRVELGMYEGVPHLFTPIITDPKLAANALRNAVREMERRLKLLASRSVRNIDQYNKLFDSSMPSLFDDGETEEPLPYIVIIIDEMADLMMLDRANVEESITRLAQMARAVGIHLILATQRPSVDVITGLIKANVPTRISFRLATKVDSRTILDTNGAESLLGRGDMLFLPPGTSRLVRIHAPYVSEKETAAVVDFWKAQGQAEYAEGFLDSPKDDRPGAEGGAGDGDDNDPLYNDAVQLVFEFQKASTSLLQRRLRVGYGRAAHLIDIMEADGLVGPADGSRPRELLKPPGWLHEVQSDVE